MAKNSDLEDRVCFVWNTERPYLDKTQKSSTFSLLGFEWHLELQLLTDQIGYVEYSMYLKRNIVQKPFNEHFYITPFITVDSTDGPLPSPGQITKITNRNTNTNTAFWGFTNKEVAKYKNFAKWKIVCLFQDISPVYHNKNKIKEESTQTDLHHLSTSADKCLQTSLYISDIEKLSSDFSNLLELQMHPDANLRCEGRIMKVHKAILSARSDVFKSMFQSSAVESKDNIYDVLDLTALVLDLILKYAYTGIISDFSEETAVDLYFGARKYGMNCLQKACSDWMIANLTVSNCIDFLHVVSVYDDVFLKNELVLFICSNPKVFYTVNWFKFSKNSILLANEVLQSFVTSLNLEAE